MELTCIHTESGLCPECQQAYDDDPEAYIEFGEHLQGIANWHRLVDEMNAAAAEERSYQEDGEMPVYPDDEIPF